MKKSFLKTSINEKITVVDSDGVVQQESIKKHTFLANTKEEFFLGYAGLIGMFQKMNQAEIRIFGYCLNYRSAKFDISKKVRLSMSKQIDLNERTILNTIPLLIEKNILYKHEDGLYQINPRYVFYGSSSDRNNELKTIIELGCKNC